MKYIIITLSLLFIGATCMSAEKDGHNEKCSKKVTEDVEIKEVAKALNEAKEEAKRQIQELSDTATLDVDAIRRSVEDNAPDWSPDRVRRYVAEKVVEAAGKLNEAKTAATASALAGLDVSYETAKKNVKPFAHFQGNARWQKDRRQNASWTAITCNPKGNSGATLGAGFGIEFDLNLIVEIKFKCTAKGACTWKVAKFDPVDPKTGTGESVRVVATPHWEAAPQGEVSLQLFMTVSVTAGVVITGQLDDVKAELKLPAGCPQDL